ncbi:(2Fe-2S) ferredoxin domain-containing protein, partial [bacterium]|nr:(2Fe-2S) ferredoxin domain-containing protein [bacterium]
MTKVKSLEDLKRIREEALQKRDAKNVEGQKQVTVGMG